MRSLLVPLVALGAICATATAQTAPLDPQRYMPPRAGMVVVWKNPGATFDRLEGMASRAGIAPPTAEPGWLRAAWTAEMPMMTALDYTRPVWVALMPQSAEAAQADETPKGVLVLPIKGKGQLLVEALKTDMKVATKGAWLVAVHKDLPDRLLKPHARPFALPDHLDHLNDASDLFGTLRVAAYPELLEMPDDDPTLASAPASLRPILSAIQSFQNAQLAEMNAVTLGAGVATDGLNVFAQVHPKPETELAKQLGSMKNYDGPLIRGLPLEDYFVVGASRVPKDAKTNPLQDMLGALLGSSNGLDPRVKKKAEELRTITGGDTNCTQYAMGISVAGSIDALRMMATSSCGSSGKLIEQLRNLVAWSADLVTMLAESESEAGDAAGSVSLRHEKQKLRVGKHELDVARLDFPPESIPAPDREAAVVLQRPFVFGAVDSKTAILAWNAPEPMLRRLAAAAEKSAPLKLPAAAAARARLASPRHTESYLFAGPLVSAFAPADVAGMLGPLRFLMAQMPPIAIAIQAQPDGSQLYQLYLPQQLAQLAASMAQMQQ